MAKARNKIYKHHHFHSNKRLHEAELGGRGEDGVLRVWGDGKRNVGVSTRCVHRAPPMPMPAIVGSWKGRRSVWASCFERGRLDENDKA